MKNLLILITIMLVGGCGKWDEWRERKETPEPEPNPEGGRNQTIYKKSNNLT